MNRNKTIKLSLCVLLVSAMLLNVGCSKKEIEEYTTPEYLSLMDEKLKTAEEVERIQLYDIQDVNCEATFDHVLDRITTVIKAIYRTTKRIDNSYVYCFEVIESMRGEEDIGKEIYVPVSDLEQCHNRDKPYEENEKYLLLLSRWVTPYTTTDFYVQVIRHMVIPIGDNGEPDTQKAKICGRSFTDSVKDPELNWACRHGGFVESLLKKIEGNPLKRQDFGFFNTFSLIEAVENSDYILTVKLLREDNRIDVFTKKYDIEIIESLKGSTDIFFTVLNFPRYAVSTGDTVIVMINSGSEDGGAPYTLSTWNSIHPLSMKEEIIKILNEAK